MTRSGIKTNKWYGRTTDFWETCEAVVKRKNNKTFYEIKVPFKSIQLKAKEGTVFGFNFVIFDDDEGAGHAYYYQNSRGITGGKSPRRFKKFVLTE